MGQAPTYGRPYHLNFFKGRLPQILLGPFLNTLSYIRCAYMQCNTAGILSTVIIENLVFKNIFNFCVFSK